MRYVGSKLRLAKHIIPFIMSEYKEGMTYIEPFVGGASMFFQVPIENRVGYDINEYAIRALKLIRDDPDRLPRNNTEYTKEMYEKARKSDLSNPVDCYAMFQYSFGGKFKDSWARDVRGRDYVKEGLGNAYKKSKGLQGTKLIHSSYLDIDVPEGSIVYCDPPYRNTEINGYSKHSKSFDYEQFYSWCEDLSDHSVVFVSEYTAPEHWEILWSREHAVTLSCKGAHRKSIEKLFRVRRDDAIR